MSQQVFSLDGIVFGDPNDKTATLFEVPEDFEFGLETWGTVHKIPQNDLSQPKMIMQTFGVFPKIMTWEGRFLGLKADDRARRFAASQIKQSVVTFTFGQRSWDVVIMKFSEKVRSRYDIGFSIEVQPLSERSGRVTTATLPKTATQALKDTYVSIQVSAQDTALSQAAFNAINPLPSVIQTYQPEAKQPVSSLLTLGQTISTTISTLQALQSSVSTSLTSADQNNFIAIGKALGYISSYGATLQTLTGQDGGVQVAHLPGSNLFATAANQLGDWTRFSDLMAVNVIADPFLQVSSKVSLPRT